jgi:hypothetical protein
MSKNILFITEQLFKDRTGASNNIDGKQIFPMVKVAGDMYIQPALGSKLYQRLQDGIVADNLTNDEKNLLDIYVTDALVWFTMSLLPMTMGFQLFSKGFLQKTAEESNTPSRADMELIEQKYLSMAEFYKTRLIKYLQENYTLYYEYLNHGSGLDVIFPEAKAYTSPIYLGNDYVPNTPRWVNGSSSYSIPQIAYYTAVGNESTFNVNDLYGRIVLVATRSGLSKVIVTAPTNDSGKIQINGNVIVLPTGDIAMAGELFTFLYR